MVMATRVSPREVGASKGTGFLMRTLTFRLGLVLCLLLYPTGEDDTASAAEPTGEDDTASAAEPITVIASILTVISVALDLVGDLVSSMDQGADPNAQILQGNSERLKQLHNRLDRYDQVLIALSQKIDHLPDRWRKELDRYFSFERRNSIRSMSTLIDEDIRQLELSRHLPVSWEERINELQMARASLFDDIFTRVESPTLDEVRALILAYTYEARSIQVATPRDAHLGGRNTADAYTQAYFGGFVKVRELINSARLSEAIALEQHQAALDRFDKHMSDNLASVEALLQLPWITPPWVGGID